MFPVSEFFLPPADDEDLPQHVARAVERLGELDPRGDVLVFLPGEREIRECAEVLEGRQFRDTEVLPLFARLGLVDQQRVFHPGAKRRLILATNVAETSLTIPRIACVVDSGCARVSRWSPGKGVQRLQVEPVSQASARQRKGRCGRVRDGVCVRLYGEEEAAERPEFSDPEIKRSSLAGVILRMKMLGLSDIEAFPFLDPPSPKAVSEGYRTLREVGAVDRQNRLTESGRRMGCLPVDPRLARMLIEAEKETCLGAVVPVIAALESSDPRERPADKAREADDAHAKWKDGDSDFISILRLWDAVQAFRDGKKRWRRNQLRTFCSGSYLNHRRVMEWANVADELADLLEREWRVTVDEMPWNEVPYAALHRSLLAGVPRQFGCWDRENKAYRSAAGGFFAVFPGSGLFGTPKRHEWVMAMELVETSRLWARRVARMDPEWMEQVAPHLCHRTYGDAHWDVAQGAVYGKETVRCGGLPVVVGRRVHYGRVDPVVARAIFLREGLLGGGIRKRCVLLDRLEMLRGEVEEMERKLRRPGGLWSEEAVLQWCEARIPEHVHTAAAFHKWLGGRDQEWPLTLADVMDEDVTCLGLDGFPDTLQHAGEEYAVYYNAAPGERDDGVTLGVHVDQLPGFPGWLPGWGVDGQLRERVEILLRAMPKEMRRACHPIADAARGFTELWAFAPKDRAIGLALAAYLANQFRVRIEPTLWDDAMLPEALRTKVWVCDDEGEELAMGCDLAVIKLGLSDRMRRRFEAVANAEVERAGMQAWDGEELPEEVETPGGPAFPALVDEGGSVGVKAFASRELARESHRAGGARLLCLAQAASVEHLRKKFPLGLMTKVELARLGVGGTSLDDLLLLAAEGAAGGEFPRSPEGFQQMVARAKGEWFVAAKRLGDALEETVTMALEIRAWIDNNREDRNRAESVADLDEEMRWLFRGRFAWRAGYARMCDYPRRMRAIRSRLGRLESLPILKDWEKRERVRRVWTPWFMRWSAEPDLPELWQVGWLLEEWRISLFAPDVPVVGKVSEKRIVELLEAGR
jgi:ATP-dependent helicase HrpA